MVWIEDVLVTPDIAVSQRQEPAPTLTALNSD